MQSADKQNSNSDQKKGHRQAHNHASHNEQDDVLIL